MSGPEYTANVAPIKSIGGYEIISTLGQGAAGTVYLAYDNASGRKVALKTMLSGATVDVESKARFIREAKSMELLSHENIVSIFGSGVSGGVFYFTLEYCSGGSLNDLVQHRNRPMPYSEAVSLICQVLKGLEYLHNVELPDGSGGFVRGLVHRDIKPANILLDMSSSGKVAKIADFGLAKVFKLAGIRDLTETGTVGGTMEFVCRQQILDYKYAKPEVDVWSTAAVLYYLLSGEPPRSLNRHQRSMMALLDADLVPLSERRKGLPSGLTELIDRALDDSSSLYYKKAGELCKALESFL